MASIHKTKEKKTKNLSEDSIPSFIRKTYEILEVNLYLFFSFQFPRMDSITMSFDGVKMELPLSLAIPQNSLKKFSHHSSNITI